ncbi:universal stress protein [Nocardioides panaciterrulae]|uniref:Nucleotide-binding universal stress UspA family protein n=1 Tax=Nocardioides panaciterrulae TaxID=661492 RepID=A0A7Y9E9W3_9ACTN|nr:universal stress protein [Nocardioides panaciterrulae]NYD43773.1 nucleotide-binding universal stress UspA family protein [Nocardioides panaciterrulae]
MTNQDKPYTVVVGVSATSKSPGALAWARAQAEANGGRAIAVRVHQVALAAAGPSGSSSRPPQDTDSLRAQQHAQLARDVAEVLGDDHGVEIRVIHGSRRRGLLNEAREADLLVIGAPRRPSMSPLLAHRIVYAATCPVVVMPPSISGVPEPAISRSARSLGRAALRSAGTSGRPGYRPPSAPGD